MYKFLNSLNIPFAEKADFRYAFLQVRKILKTKYKNLNLLPWNIAKSYATSHDPRKSLIVYVAMLPDFLLNNIINEIFLTK